MRTCSVIQKSWKLMNNHELSQTSERSQWINFSLEMQSRCLMTGAAIRHHIEQIMFALKKKKLSTSRRTNTCWDYGFNTLTPRVRVTASYLQSPQGRCRNLLPRREQWPRWLFWWHLQVFPRSAMAWWRRSCLLRAQSYESYRPSETLQQEGWVTWQQFYCAVLLVITQWFQPIQRGPILLVSCSIFYILSNKNSLIHLWKINGLKQAVLTSLSLRPPPVVDNFLLRGSAPEMVVLKRSLLSDFTPRAERNSQHTSLFETLTDMNIYLRHRMFLHKSGKAL